MKKLKNTITVETGKVIDASVIYAWILNDSHKPTCESPGQTG
jgi:hypothetical protein